MDSINELVGMPISESEWVPNLLSIRLLLWQHLLLESCYFIKFVVFFFFYIFFLLLFVLVVVNLTFA